MTCKNCIHYELCLENGTLFQCFISRGIEIEDIGTECPFKKFKNKADYVEVVGCKDCKYLYCFSAIDRQFYCKHYPKGLQDINIVEKNPFCSYGERKDT